MGLETVPLNIKAGFWESIISSTLRSMLIPFNCISLVCFLLKLFFFLYSFFLSFSFLSFSFLFESSCWSFGVTFFFLVWWTVTWTRYLCIVHCFPFSPQTFSWLLSDKLLVILSVLTKTREETTFHLGVTEKIDVLNTFHIRVQKPVKGKCFIVILPRGLYKIF